MHCLYRHELKPLLARPIHRAKARPVDVEWEQRVRMHVENLTGNQARRTLKEWMGEGLRLIQSQTPDSGLASHHVSVEDSDLCPIPG